MAKKNKNRFAPTVWYLFTLTAHKAHTQKSVNALINYLTFHLGGDGLQSPHNKQTRIYYYMLRVREYVERNRDTRKKGVNSI